MFERSELESLTKDELAQRAEDHGFTVKARTGKEDLITMLTGEDATEASADEQLADEQPLSDAEKQAAAKDQDRVRIVVHSDANDSSDVKVGFNGTMYQIKRDTEVEVPRAVYNILNDAVVTHMEPGGQNEDGSTKYRERSARRFAFDVRG